MWPGSSSNPREVIESYDECYSNWYVNSITPSITNVSASSVYSSAGTPVPARNAENVISGFFCKRLDYYCFTSAGHRNNKPYWRADLGTPKRVSSIIISNRKDVIEHFIDAEITLGNSSDYNNILFDNYNGEPPPGINIPFTPTNPVTGRYLQIQSSNATHRNAYLSMCDIVILG
ncbi:hypothetical protein Pmani_011566 [Petrolisthes manimaculis]|uniref:Fucolectin tachylectin-4 pentraxin-1 domain-containing protein n=1 Tax=Petrolisthes manimaculis TaxID=1843537 RepID=A0AAE1UG26_9EUCA|nr:hypothetical protein Pmani_011566 [Petrolisthes manimaculis]